MKELNECISSLEGLEYLYNHLDKLDPLCPIGEQFLDLGEDLFQAEFHDGTIVDVGFYPWSPDGSFKILVIRYGDWVNPVKHFECKEIANLCSLLIAVLIDVSTRSRNQKGS